MKVIMLSLIAVFQFNYAYAVDLSTCSWPLPAIQEFHSYDEVKGYIENCHPNTQEVFKNAMAGCKMVSPADGLYNPICLRGARNIIKNKNYDEEKTVELTKINLLVEISTENLLCTNQFSNRPAVIQNAANSMRNTINCEDSLEDRIARASAIQDQLASSTPEPTPMATSCPNVNLLNSNSQSALSRMRKSYQVLGTCYAHAATHMMDFAILTADPNAEVTSTLWTAYLYTKEKKEKKIAGGFVVDSYNLIQKHGICSHETIVKGLAETMGIDPSAYDPKELEADVAFFENILIGTNSCKEETGTFVSETQECSIKKKKNEYLAFLAQIAEDKDSMINILDEVLAPCFNDANRTFPATDKLVNKDYTSENVPMENASSNVNAITQESKNDMKQRIKSNLLASKPVVMSHCAEIYGNANYNYTWDNSGTIYGGCGGHASLIVGSRKHGDSCQYLVRSTWSHGNDSAVEQGSAWPIYVNENSEMEGWWIDEDALSNAIYRLQVFE